MNLTEQEKTAKDIELAFSSGLNKDHSVLDLGCGSGRHSIELITRGQRQVVGVDIDMLDLTEAAKKSRELSIRGNLNFVRSSWFALPFLDHKFDFVLLFYSGIDNLSSPEKMLVLLHEVGRMLKPEGKVLFHVSNGDEIIKAHTNPENGQIVRREQDYPYIESDKEFTWHHATWIDLEGQMKYSRDEIITEGVITESVDQPPSRFFTTQQYKEILSMVGLNLYQTLPYPFEAFEAEFGSVILSGR